MAALASPVMQRQSEALPVQAFRGGSGGGGSDSSSGSSGPAVQLSSMRGAGSASPRISGAGTGSGSGSGSGVLRRTGPAPIARQASASAVIQRSATPSAASGGDVPARIQSSLTGGTPLPASVRRFMEPRLGASFAGVPARAEIDSALPAAAAPQAFTGQQPSPATPEKRGHWDRLKDAAGEVLDFSEGVAWKLLDQFAPELVPILRKGPEGVLDWLKERVTSAAETVFDNLMAPVRSIAGAGRQLSGTFAPMLAWLQDAVVKISKNDCTPLREAADKIEQTATRLIQPVIEKLQPVIAKVQGFFSGLWDKFGAPIWDWIKKVAAQQWAQIEGLANWIWGKTAPIRNLLSKAWTWLKNKLGIGDGPEGQNGILQWVQAKLGAAWEWVKVKLGPYKREIAVIAGVAGGIALMLSPAGPVLAVGGLVVGVVQAVRWIKANWGKGVVHARTYVQKTLIPGLINASTALTAKLTVVAASIDRSLGGLASGLGRLVGAAAGSALRFAVGAAQWIAEQANDLAQWAKEKLAAVAQWLSEALGKLQKFGQRVMDFLGDVGQVVGNVYAVKVLKKLWSLIPACIRNPVIDYLIPLILRQVELFQELVRDNEAWQKTKADVMHIVKLVFEDHDLHGALRAVFRLILRGFNIPPELLGTIQQKAIKAWDVVSKKPLAFIKNLLRSVGHGFGLLWKNITGHLTYGLERWLIGPLADKGIQAPASWTDPKALFGFALDVMGLSVDHIFELLKKRFDAAKVDKLRSIYGKVKSAWAWVQQSIDTSKSPAENTKGLIEQAKGFAASVFSGLAQWIAGKVATELAAYAVAAAASAGISAVLDAFRRIYKALLTAKRWMRQILDMVNEALDDVGAVASGAIDKVGEKFEKLMHRGMPVVISFLGDQVGLGDLPTRLRAVIDTLRAKVDIAILWLIDKIKAALDALVAGAKAALKWWQERVEFKTKDGREHHIFTEGEIDSARIYVKSNEVELGDLVKRVGQPARKKALVLQSNIKTIMLAGSKGGKTEADMNKLSSDLKVQLKAMGALLADAGVLNELPTPSYTFNAPGGIASVIDLSPMRPWGSTPSDAESPNGWNYAREVGMTDMKTSKPSKYAKAFGLRRLHLINERFGGPGTAANLAVASKTNNESHLYDVENKIKEIVGKVPGDGTALGVIDNYTVSVAYRPSKKLASNGVTSDMSAFPKHFICTWIYHELDSSAKRVKVEKKETIGFGDDWARELEKRSD